MSDALRKAALTLSSLHEGDRAWLLARMEKDERARVSPLLAELRELGITLDAHSARQFAQTETPAEKARPIDGASARTVHDILSREPDWVIAIVLRARAWQWRGELLQLLGTERRLRVQRARPSANEVRPRMVEALLAAMEARLDEQSADAAWEEPEKTKRFSRDLGRKLWGEVLRWRR